MELLKACKKLMITEPFYGLFLTTLNKRYSDETKTACVQTNGVFFELLVNKNFWDSLSDDEQLAILKHELMHICFHHLEHYDEFENQLIANYACDLEINQYIENLPKSVITLNTFKELNLQPKAGTKYYYNELIKNITIIELPDFGDSHENWKTMNSYLKKLIKNQLDDNLRKISNQSYGLIPGELQEYINLLNNKPIVIFNWKSYLRRLIGSSQIIFTKKTNRKESKRFLGSPGLKIKCKQKLLLGIDTSGSIQQLEFEEYANEISIISKENLEMEVIEFDTKINKIYKYKKKLDSNFSGRGGTDFKEIIDYYNKSNFTTLVLFTDGYADLTNFKSKKQIIWVITSNGNHQGKYPGKTVIIKK